MGRIAVHRPGSEPVLLTGATRILLAILVAAGPDGTTLEQIADAYWPQDRPASWDTALRVSASHLKARLPADWDVAATSSHIRLLAGRGFVDAWRIDDELGDMGHAVESPRWIEPGAPFAGIDGIDLIDCAAARIERIVPTESRVVQGLSPFTDALPLSQQQHAALRRWIGTTQRAIVSAAPERHAAIVSAALADQTTATNVVVGDRGLPLPLGPFAVAFPELRSRIRFEQGMVGAGAVEEAFRAVTGALAIRAADRPQRLLIANAHQLDTKSLALVAHLIDRVPLNDLSITMCADSSYRDLRWLDFMRRCVTAGCTLIEADEPRRR